MLQKHPGLVFKKPSTLLATWFGCGLMHPAPGTWGSLGAIPFGILLLVAGGPVLLGLCALLLFPVGIWATRQIINTAHNGSETDAKADHDPKIVVIDEVVGQWIALLPALSNPVYIVLAFLFFRFFDIVKPWPVSYFDREITGPWGVMLDDVMAGILAAICLLGVHYAGFI